MIYKPKLAGDAEMNSCAKASDLVIFSGLWPMNIRGLRFESKSSTAASSRQVGSVNQSMSMPAPMLMLKNIAKKLSRCLGLHQRPVRGLASIFGAGMAIFVLNAILILLFISFIGDVYVVGRGSEAAMQAFYFQFSMIIQSFFFFDPFADSDEAYDPTLWRDLFMFIRIFFAFFVWGVAAKLLSSFAVEASSRHSCRVVLCAMAFVCVSLASIPLSLHASGAGAPCFRNGIKRELYKLNGVGQRLDELRLLPTSIDAP